MSSPSQKPYSMFSNKESDTQLKKTSVVPDLDTKNIGPTKSHSQDADRHSKIPHIKSGK